MGRRKLYDIDALAGRLYDMLAGAETICPHDVRGLTIHEITAKLDVPAQVVRRVIRSQRLLFGSDDEINVPIHICGTDRVYHLSAEILAGQQWMAARLKNEMAQEQVNIAWWQSMVRANAHDDVRRRYSELVLRDHERLLEDLTRLL
jgi:hypothetical protein